MSTELRQPNPVLVEINRRNDEFWREQRTLRDHRITDAAILATAIADITSELTRGVDIKAQKIFEEALADAEAAMQRFASQRGRYAGSANKADPLQLLIDEAVRRKPTITEVELRRQLQNHARIPPIEDFTADTISVTKIDGTIKDVPLSGLKHRLSRAKKKLKKN